MYHQWITFGASTPVFNDDIRDDNGMPTLYSSSETLSTGTGEATQLSVDFPPRLSPVLQIQRDLPSPL